MVFVEIFNEVDNGIVNVLKMRILDTVNIIELTVPLNLISVISLVVLVERGNIPPAAVAN